MTQYTPAVVVKPGKPPVTTDTEQQQHPTKRTVCRGLKILLVLLVGLLLLIPLPYLTDTTTDDMATKSAASDGVVGMPMHESLSKFTVDMYLALAKQEEGENVFFSPFSVMTALSMTLMGCRSNTHKQLTSVLKLEQDDLKLRETFSDIIRKYQTVVPEYELRTANMMYASHKLQMEPQFSHVLQNYFKATAKTVDFGGQAEQVRAEINAAVEKETNSKIKDLIPSGIFDDLTRLVLINAVYFKGLWTKPFDKSLTVNRPFWQSEDSSIGVQMMYIKSKFLHSVNRELDASVLSMDYKGSNLSMVIVLPNTRTGLAAVEEKLAGVSLTGLAQAGRMIELEVYLPRFKLEYSKDLKDTIIGLGAPDLFSVASDLSGIGGEPGYLYVSKVIHKAFLEVNEEGSEAAAATAVVIPARCLPPPPQRFTADHPFLFFIYDHSLSTVFFMGRVMT